MTFSNAAYHCSAAADRLRERGGCEDALCLNLDDIAEALQAISLPRPIDDMIESLKPVVKMLDKHALMTVNYTDSLTVSMDSIERGSVSNPIASAAFDAPFVFTINGKWLLSALTELAALSKKGNERLIDVSINGTFALSYAGREIRLAPLTV